MKRIFLPLLLTFISLSISPTLYGEAGPICAGLLGDANATSGQYVPAYTRWETDPVTGDVTITIFNPGESANVSAPTRWRLRGMAEAVSKEKGWTLKINGNPVNDISEYFEKEYTSNGTQSKAPSVYKLKLKAGKTPFQDVPRGSIIEFNKTDKATDNVCWWTPLGNNAYGNKYSFEYEYGSTCVALSAPDNLNISEDNEITFDDVTGAVSYKLYTYFSGSLIQIQSINSGTTLTRPMKLGGTYVLKVTATDANGTESEESDGVNWILTDLSTAEEDLPTSVFCSVPLIANDNAACMTWETDEDGNINISISGKDVTWRNKALQEVSNFKVGNVSATSFFDKEYTSNSTIYQLKKKNGVTIALGETITFNGNIEWKTSSGSPYLQNQTYTYTYGSKCNEPDVLTTYNLAADASVAQVGSNVNLTITSLNQKGTAMDVETEYTISPADAGTITNNVFTPSKKGLATITASSENDKSSEITIFAYEGSNLAYHKQKECNPDAYSGSLESQYVTNSPSLAVNEKTGDNNYWQGYSAQNCNNNAEFNAWLTLDLGGIYDIDLVQVRFHGSASSRKYHLDFSSDYENWTTAYSYNETNTTRDRNDYWYTNTTDNKEVRYIRFFSEAVNNSYGVKVAEIYV